MSQVYTHTGYARMRNLTISRGYDSSTYSILDQFTYNETTYPSITSDQFAKMSSSDYNIRRSAFINHIYSINEGLRADCPNMETGSQIYDVDKCPLTEHTNDEWNPI